MISPSRSLPTVSLFLSLALGACAPATDGDDVLHDEVDATTGAIVNGTIVTGPDFGPVKLIVGKNICSGNLVSGFATTPNEWVVTARHCFDAASTTLTTGAGVVVSTAAATRNADRVLLHPTLDVALVRMKTGISTGFTLPSALYSPLPGFPVALTKGMPLQCYGYGEGVLNPDLTTGGVGTLRTATLLVEDIIQELDTDPTGKALTTTHDAVLVAPDVFANKWLAGGDSGGYCTFVDPTTGVILDAGITSHGFGYPAQETSLVASWASSSSFPIPVATWVWNQIVANPHATKSPLEGLDLSSFTRSGTTDSRLGNILWP